MKNLTDKKDYTEFYKVHFNIDLDIDYVNKTISCTETGDIFATFTNNSYVKKYIIDGKPLIGVPYIKIEGMKPLNIRVKKIANIG